MVKENKKQGEKCLVVEAIIKCNCERCKQLRELEKINLKIYVAEKTMDILYNTFKNETK